MALGVLINHKARKEYKGKRGRGVLSCFQRASPRGVRISTKSHETKGPGAGGFVDRYIRLLNYPYVQREEFNIPRGPVNRRSNYSTNPEPQIFRRAIHF